LSTNKQHTLSLIACCYSDAPLPGLLCFDYRILLVENSLCVGAHAGMAWHAPIGTQTWFNMTGKRGKSHLPLPAFKYQKKKILWILFNKNIFFLNAASLTFLSLPSNTGPSRATTYSGLATTHFWTKKKLPKKSTRLREGF